MHNWNRFQRPVARFDRGALLSLMALVVMFAEGCNSTIVSVPTLALSESISTDRFETRQQSDDVASETQTLSSSERFINSLEMHFRLIPAGEFLMGADDTSLIGAAAVCEQPAHRVLLTRSFWMSECEVTVGAFREFVVETGRLTTPEQSGLGANGLDSETGEVVQSPAWIWSSPGFTQTERHPVVCISWDDAQAFCRWLSDKEARTYRLPTEVEWEYACRAGSKTSLSTGDVDALRCTTNAADAALKRVFPGASWAAPWDDGFAYTAPVGSFQPNRFGLFDMQGNVGEWCADWFSPNFYAVSPVVDPQGPLEPNLWRVVRGGSWYNVTTSCRITGRHDGGPTAPSTTNGFRIVRDCDP